MTVAQPGDVLIIGAGPSGLAAAFAAAQSGAHVKVIDDNFCSGGQIWRGGAERYRDSRARELWNALLALPNVHFYFQSKVVHAEKIQQIDSASATDTQAGYQVVIESLSSTQTLYAKTIIVCTGARELLLPFPGWTAPGVTGAGGLQALAKNGFPVTGKRVVVAGTGPLLLAVAATLIERGAIVTHIIEQTRFQELGKFALGLLTTPSKITQAISLWSQLRPIRYFSDSYVTAAFGVDQLQSVQISQAGELITIECDLLACGYGLIPNVEMAAGLGCALQDNGHYQQIEVTPFQETSLQHVYCAGEGTGVGGVDLALSEGYIAGYAATVQTHRAKEYFATREKWKKFAQRLQRHFALRSELRELSEPATIVCRCEDVNYGQLQQHGDWRSAKLHTRCGMGACQGRVCGAANRFLFSWERDQGRLPVSCARIESLTTHSQ